MATLRRRFFIEMAAEKSCTAMQLAFVEVLAFLCSGYGRLLSG